MVILCGIALSGENLSDTIVSGATLSSVSLRDVILSSATPNCASLVLHPLWYSPSGTRNDLADHFKGLSFFSH